MSTTGQQHLQFLTTICEDSLERGPKSLSEIDMNNGVSMLAVGKSILKETNDNVSFTKGF